MNDIIPPSDTEVEELILGTIISERNAIYEVQDIISEEIFYKEKNKEIFRAIKTILDRGDRADIISVNHELKKMDSSISPYELSIISTKHTFDIYQHTALLYDKSIRRKFIEIGQFLMSNASSEVNDIEDVIGQSTNMISDLLKKTSNTFKGIYDVVNEMWQMISRNSASEKKITGNPTGFSELDNHTGGFQKSDLIIIAGESSQGKTSFLLSILSNMAKSGSKLAIYSLEMSNVQISARMTSMETGIPAKDIMFSKLDNERIKIIDKNLSTILNYNIYFDDRSSSNIDTIIASIRSMKIKFDIEGAAIDYLQILNVNSKGLNPEQQMASVARRLKNLAKELDIWIVALSQLNRDSQNPVPNLNRLRDSGQIAEASDSVIFIYRPEYYNRNFPFPFENVSTENNAMIDFAKGRNVGITKFILGFDKQLTKFFDRESYDEIGFKNLEKQRPF